MIAKKKGLNTPRSAVVGIIDMETIAKKGLRAGDGINMETVAKKKRGGLIQRGAGIRINTKTIARKGLIHQEAPV